MQREDVVKVLNDLIETCKDGEYGFNTCAEHVQSAELRALFSDRARDCRRGAEELQALVTQYGGTPDTGGSATGALHRGWVNVRGSLAGYSDKAMLQECERGEDAAKARYRDALEEDLPEDVRRVVQSQFEGVLRNHDQIKALRDRFEAV